MNGNPEVPLRLIAKVARQFYPTLPPSAKAYMDPEDLIQYGVACWLSRIKNFDPKRATFSTFTVLVVRSHYLEMIRMFRRARHAQELQVCLDEVSPDRIATRGKLEKQCQAEDRVNRFFALASPGLRTLFREYYFEQSRVFRGWNSRFDKFRGELSWLIRTTGVTADDFRVVAPATLR